MGLALAPDVASPVKARIAAVAAVTADIAAGRVAIPEAYDGPEFATP